MAAPDHRRAGVVDRGHQPGGLRIVQDHDVIGAHQLGELSRTRGQGALIDGAFIGPQWAPVSVDPVQMVVQPFGDRQRTTPRRRSPPSARRHRPRGSSRAAVATTRRRRLRSRWSSRSRSPGPAAIVPSDRSAASRAAYSPAEITDSKRCGSMAATATCSSAPIPHTSPPPARAHNRRSTDRRPARTRMAGVQLRT